MARKIMYNNFEISLVVFMPNITTYHAITVPILISLACYESLSTQSAFFGLFRFPNIFAPARSIISEGNWEAESDIHSGPPVPIQT